MVVRTSSRETKFLNLSANHIRASIFQPITSELQSFSQSHQSFNLSANHIRAPIFQPITSELESLNQSHQSYQYKPSRTYILDPTSPSFMMTVSFLNSTEYMQSTISAILAGDRCRRKSSTSIACRIRSFELQVENNRRTSLR